MDWREIAARDDAQFSWVAEITAAGQVLRRGTRAIPTAGVDAGLLSLSQVVRGISDSIDGPPERAGVEITLANNDRSLDWLIAGGVPGFEYRGKSVLTTVVQLFLYAVGPGGEWARTPVTPTLCLAGDLTNKETTISLQLGSRDEELVGSTIPQVTVQDLIDGAMIEVHEIGTDGAERPMSASDWGEVRSVVTANLDHEVPWAYGRLAAPLLLVSKQNDKSYVVFGWLQRDDPSLSSLRRCEILSDTYDGEPSRFLVRSWDRRWVFKVKIHVDDDVGDVWLIGIRTDGVLTAETDQFLRTQHYLDTRYYAAGGATGTPPRLAWRIIEDHAERSAGAIDLASFQSAWEGAESLQWAWGGVVTSGDSIASVLGKLGPFGFAFWISLDDRVHVLDVGAWPDGDVAAELGLADVTEGTFSERLPMAPGSRGAPATDIEIGWTAAQEELFPAGYLQETWPGLNRAALTQRSKVTVPGDWIWPPMVLDAATAAAARIAYPTRRVTVTVPLRFADLDLGTQVRLTHPLGPGGYRRRLYLVERITITPAECGVELQLEDLGPLEELHTGILDSRANWVVWRASVVQVKLDLDGQRVKVASGTGPFTKEDQGRTLVILGASHPGNRGSWKITKFTDKNNIECAAAAFVTETLVQPAPGGAVIDEQWVVLRNRTSDPGHREEYICVASEETGTFTDATTGFAMLA